MWEPQVKRDRPRADTARANGVHCVPCNMTVVAEQREHHRRTLSHRAALMRLHYLKVEGLAPLDVTSTTKVGAVPLSEQEKDALLSLLVHANVPVKIDTYKVDHEVRSPPEGGAQQVVEVEVEGPYAPLWVAELWNSKLSRLEVLAWIFELSQQPDASAVASTVAAMVARAERGSPP